MSRLIDMLERSGERAAAPLGFGSASARQAAAPQVLLIARVLSEKLKEDPALAEADADAFLVGARSTDDSTLDMIGQTLEKRVWGVRLPEFTAAQAKALKDKGCDFIVFESMDTEAAVLNEESLGVIVTASHDVGDEVARAMRGLPLDGVLYSPSLRSFPLTVQALVDIRKVLGLLGGPFVVEAPNGIASGDIEALRNLGIAGLVSDLDAAGDLEKLAKLRTDIAKLPRRRPKRERQTVVLPQTPSPAAQPEPAPDEEDDDDF